MNKLKTGVLLVASSVLDRDPDFRQSLIFLAAYDAAFVFGFNIAGPVEDDWLTIGGPLDQGAIGRIIPRRNGLFCFSPVIPESSYNRTISYCSWV